GRYRVRLDRNAHQAGYFGRRFPIRASAETGAMIMETPRIWLEHEKCLQKTHCADQTVVEWLRRQNRGILSLTPHLGSFEITAPRITHSTPVPVMFRPPRWTPLAAVMEQARNIQGLKAVPANRQGMRHIVRALRSGEAVGMLPDQVPRGGEGL